jgi:hypothetical protein
VSKATHGHDICSADPWVFGFTFSGNPLHYGPLAHHPHTEGHAGSRQYSPRGAQHHALGGPGAGTRNLAPTGTLEANEGHVRYGSLATLEIGSGMSALPPEADIRQCGLNVRKVP